VSVVVCLSNDLSICKRGCDDSRLIFLTFHLPKPLKHLYVLISAPRRCAGVGAASSPVGGPCEPVCVVMYDPWYPAIPDDSPARSTWVSGCPALVLGTQAFNTKSEKGTIAAEGEHVGLQVCATPHS
jgi:hypothetical protein